MLFICSLTDPPSLSLNENSFLLNCNLLAQVFLWNCSSSLVQTACGSSGFPSRYSNDGSTASTILAASGGKPVQSSYQTIRCHFCHKPGHIKKDCRRYHKWVSKKQNAAVAEVKQNSDDEALVATQMLAAAATLKGNWIVDSGATCHMANDNTMFSELKVLSTPQDVTIGDGRSLKGTAIGTVKLETLLPNRGTKKCTLSDVLLVPGLAYSLLSVSKISSTGKTTKFNIKGCEILNSQDKIIAFATRIGNLYHLEFCQPTQSVNNAKNNDQEKLWHRRFGHLGEQNLQKLAREKLVKSFNYDVSKSIGFCETCVGGKRHRRSFSTSNTRATEPLQLVHSDICGKMSEKSLGRAEYFLTFTDDYTRFTWTYILKTKDQVWEKLMEWKALVEKQSNRKLKVLRTDNGGEYTSKKFEEYLKKEGIRHEKTIPKTPEQNGVSERLNRTLVESATSMLLDANLSKCYWAEAIATATYLKNRCPTKICRRKNSL